MEPASAVISRACFTGLTQIPPRAANNTLLSTIALETALKEGQRSLVGISIFGSNPRNCVETKVEGVFAFLYLNV